MNRKQKTVAVAMSGGVDSSVAAVLLKERGYEIFGITMVHFDSPCNKAVQAAHDAEEVCRHLDINHVTIDLHDEFRERVIDNFIQEYLNGRTPNPCVQCNMSIKWGTILQKAEELGADFIATGHYVNILFDPKTKRFVLLKSEHRAKDQSYALWRLTQEQLSHTLFPIANLPKSKVRDMALSLGLDIADKAESQDICFIPDNDYKAFIKEYLENSLDQIKPGPILDLQGNIIGTHKGYPYYTIGQRKGLGIARGRPQYVVEIDPQANTIRIGEKSDLLNKGLVAESTNWISVEKPTPGMKVLAHIRYNDPGYSAEITKVDSNAVTIVFDEPRESVTPGQSVVLYNGAQLVGGGIISCALQ